jgi:protein-disulfide isomerase
VTLVEFTDFGCTYCRQSVADIEALIAANPDLRVVIRELPILSPQSADAAKMALAAAEQGKYAAFHRAMFAAGRPGPETIAAAAKAAGLDMDRARKTIADPRVEAELERNVDFARQLGFNGTPSWIAGEQLLSGAVGKDRLAEAIEAAAKS